MSAFRGILLIMITSTLLAQARGDTVVRSGPGKTHLLELFTSEGCSSCPPAEEWLSSRRADTRLWVGYVPVAFHVDYWDYLGWRDKLADPAYSLRQRHYSSAWGAHSVYTPGFVLDGAEWRPRAHADLPHASSSAQPGLLSAILHGNGDMHLTYQPGSHTERSYGIHAALLGLGLKSDVRAGENSGRILTHDFAVLIHRESLASSTPGGVQVDMRLPIPQRTKAGLALAVWVADPNTGAIIQAAGGLLAKEDPK
jgi:hypothetical protein